MADPTVAPLKETSFPRTPVILIFSGLVICALSVIIFWVFRCRQQDEKPQNFFQNEYVPVASESGSKNITQVNGCINMKNGKISETTTLNNNEEAWGSDPPQVPPHKGKSDFKEWYV